MIIKATNNLDTLAQNTYLATAHSAGNGTLSVKNVLGFGTSYALQLGKTGESQSEIVLVSTTPPSNGSVVLTGTLSYDHANDTPVYAIKYDRVVFKVSSTGTAGTANPVTNSTVSIMPNLPTTVFDYAGAGTGDAYKVVYNNSITGETSQESDWITTSGYSFYSLAKMRDRVKRKLISASYIKDDATIDDWLNEWLERMTNAAIDVNRDYLLGTTQVTFSGTTELGTINATDFKEIRRAWITYDGNDYYRMTQMNINELYPQQTFSDTQPYFAYYGDNAILRKPSVSNATVNLIYYKTTPVLVNDTDELPLSMHNYSKSFVDYAMSQAFFLDEKLEKGNIFMGMAGNELERFKQEIAPRHKAGAQTITLTDPIDGADYYKYP